MVRQGSLRAHLRPRGAPPSCDLAGSLGQIRGGGGRWGGRRKGQGRAQPVGPGSLEKLMSSPGVPPADAGSVGACRHLPGRCPS